MMIGTLANGCRMIRNILETRPLACWCLLYLLGSAAAVLFTGGRERACLAKVDHAGLIVCVVTLGVVPLWATFVPQRLSGRRIAQAGRLAAIVGLGAFMTLLRIEIPGTDVSHVASAHLVVVRGAVVSDRHSTPAGISFAVVCEEVLRGNRARRVTGRAQIWIPRGFHRESEYRLPRTGWGDTLEIRGVIHSIDPPAKPVEEGLRLHQINSVVQVGKGGTIRVLARGGPGLERFCLQARDWILDGLRPLLENQEREVLSGLLFHQKDQMEPQILNDLQRTGTIHIIATAGLHVGIFLVSCLWVLKGALPRRGAVIICLLLLPGYCIACGGWPAALRATILAELSLLAWLLGRLPDPLTGLSLAAAGMVTANPLSLMDPGFQLTFLTVITIVIALPRPDPLESDVDLSIPGRLRSVNWAREKLKEVFCLSLGAQLGSWPLTAAYFGVVSYVGILANLVIVPLLMVVEPLALGTSLLAHLLPAGAALPAALLEVLLHELLSTARWFADMPGAWSEIDPPSWQAMVAYYGVLWGLMGWLRLRLEYWPTEES